MTQDIDLHLVDVRLVDLLPKAPPIEDILIAAPTDLMARKVVTYHSRRGQPKAGSD